MLALRTMGLRSVLPVVARAIEQRLWCVFWSWAITHGESASFLEGAKLRGGLAVGCIKEESSHFFRSGSASVLALVSIFGLLFRGRDL
jgi:hypothetical protein